VSFAGWSPFGGGNEVHIDHPNGLQTWYAHMNGFNIGGGQQVSQGQTIGPVGMTGLATGPHLHYMVLDGGWPFVLNPMDYLNGGGNAGSNPAAAFINPLAGLLDGFLSSVKAAFPDAGPMLEVAIGAVKTVFDDAMKGIGDMIAGTNDGKGTKGRTGGGRPGVTLFDGGGWLEQSAQPFLMQHKRRQPDAVLSNPDWQNISTLANKAREDMKGGPGRDDLLDALENAQFELVGMDLLSNAVAARIRLARSRR
jgi:hypothetical protein